MAFTTKHEKSPHIKPSYRKERPCCTHCKYQGHTIEKCYKLHDYPPGFKTKQRSNTGSRTGGSDTANLSSTMVNQISNQVTNSSSPEDHTAKSDANVENFFQNLDNTRCTQLMNLLAQHITSTSMSVDHLNSSTSTCSASICCSVSIDHLFSSSSTWIVDSGASRHICTDISKFVPIHPIVKSNVLLPNHSSIPVYFSSVVKLNQQLILQDVLFIPHFRTNLLSISSLTKASHLTITFLSDHFILQEIQHRRVIGKDNRLPNLYVLTTGNPDQELLAHSNVVQINIVGADI